MIAEEFPFALPKLKVNRSSYLVIVTRGHAYDQEVLEWAVGTEARYLGMIGSRRKIKTVYDNLAAKGIPPEKSQRVHPPGGLKIGALTPEEIAVSIVAEMIQENGKILGTIGGGCLEAEVWEEAMKIIKEEKPRTVHFDLPGKKAEEIGMICGGVMDIYIEPVVPTPKVFIFGGGHISLFLAKICAMVGFQVAVIDDRPQFANKERFTEAGEVIAEEFPFALPKLKVNRSSYLVIVTRGTFLSTRAQEEHDCVNKRFRLVAIERFAGNMGTGQSIYKKSGESHWAPIPRETMAQSVWKFVCGKK